MFFSGKTGMIYRFSLSQRRDRRSPIAGIMLGQRLRRWPDINPAMGERLGDCCQRKHDDSHVLLDADARLNGDELVKTEKRRNC